MDFFAIAIIVLLWCAVIAHRFLFKEEYHKQFIIRWHIRIEFVLICILTIMLILHYVEIWNIYGLA